VKLCLTPAQGSGMSTYGRVLTLLTIAIAVCLAAPTGALASGKQVIRDCTDDGKLSHGYSQQDYKDALANLPTDVDEYTDCRDVIRHAQLGGAGGGDSNDGGGSGGSGGFGGSGGGPTATPSSAQEQSDVDKARSGADSSPITVGGRTVTPGAARFTSSDVHNSLPTPILVALIMLGAGAVAGGGWAARRRVFPRRTA
jgi:hypothetical protein